MSLKKKRLAFFIFSSKEDFGTLYFRSELAGGQRAEADSEGAELVCGGQRHQDQHE